MPHPTLRPARAGARNRRRILCVAPRSTHSFGTFDHAHALMGVRAFMPPQGILVIAAWLPEAWDVRFVDENVRPVTDRDLDGAEAVFLTGMHAQRGRIHALVERARARGRLTVLGGPSVSACPEWYPDPDILHLGELGDATEALVARVDASVERPCTQEVYEAKVRLPLCEFPVPAYRHIRLTDYFLASVQFSSGCPFRCDFCDIPALYGRNPRLKRPEQICAELDAMLCRGNPGAVYFVDDNFIGNRRAAVELLDYLIRWQEARGFPVEFACEATLNVVQFPDVLERMRDAAFRTMFCGVETPEEAALESIHKEQNLRRPILEAIQTLNRYGIEVVSGIILGLDTDTPRTGERIVRFIEESRIPVLTINLLHALPRTPLWDRLEAAGRIREVPGRDTNVEYLLPYEDVLRMWRETVAAAYTPEAIYGRFAHQMEHTYPNRRQLPASRSRVNPASILRGLGILARLVWHAGIRADYRRVFWRMALPALRRLDLESVVHVGVVSHHMIRYARECAAGEGESAFYSARAREERGGTPSRWPLAGS